MDSIHWFDLYCVKWKQIGILLYQIDTVVLLGAIRIVLYFDITSILVFFLVGV